MEANDTRTMLALGQRDGEIHARENLGGFTAYSFSDSERLGRLWEQDLRGMRVVVATKALWRLWLHVDQHDIDGHEGHLGHDPVMTAPPMTLTPEGVRCAGCTAYLDAFMVGTVTELANLTVARDPSVADVVPRSWSLGPGLSDGPAPVGLAEIADRLGVARATVDSWQSRGVLPEPRWTVGGRPAWSWVSDIAPWAERTGRLPQT